MQRHGLPAVRRENVKIVQWVELALRELMKAVDSNLCFSLTVSCSQLRFVLLMIVVADLHRRPASDQGRTHHSDLRPAETIEPSAHEPDRAQKGPETRLRRARVRRASQFRLSIECARSRDHNHRSARALAIRLYEATVRLTGECCPWSLKVQP
jgi:hypothetical protein